MALKKDTKDRLEVAIGSKKTSDSVIAKIEGKHPLTAREEDVMKEILADNKAGHAVARILAAPDNKTAADAYKAEQNAALADAIAATAAAQAALDADPGNPALEADLAAAQAAQADAQYSSDQADAAAAAAAQELIDCKPLPKDAKARIDVMLADDKAAADLIAEIEA